MRVKLTLLVIVLSVVSGATAAAGTTPYPLDIEAAAAKAYGHAFRGTSRFCEVYIRDRDLEGLVAVQLAGGKKDVAAFQFINTAGWFNYWRHGKPAPGAREMLPGLRAKITKLKRACSSAW